MNIPALVFGVLCATVIVTSAEVTQFNVMQAQRAQEASIQVHKSVMQKIFGVNVSYSGVVVPRSKQRRLPIGADLRRTVQPFENVSVHPLTGRAEGIALLSINF